MCEALLVKSEKPDTRKCVYIEFNVVSRIEFKVITNDSRCIMFQE